MNAKPESRHAGRAAALALAGLAACGGGGGGGSGSPPATAPSLAIASPADGAELPGGAVSVVLSYAGDDLDLATLVLSVDGQAVAGLSLGPTSASVTLLGLIEGPHDLAATISTTTGLVAGHVSGFDVPQIAVPSDPLLFDWPATGPSQFFGESLAAIEDFDGDGRADLLAGAPVASPNGPASGAARILSAASGQLLLEIAGPRAQARFGASAALVGDVDGDGHADFAVGANGDVVGGVAGGSVRVHSGATGAELLVLEPEADDDGLGASVSAVGDVDLDGVPDVLAGANASYVAGIVAGYAKVYSGADGHVLHTAYGNDSSDQLGIAVAGPGDLTGDGIPEFAAGAWGEDWNGLSSGSVRVFSGLDAALHVRVDGDAFNDHLGNSLAALGDVDGDSIGDLAVGILYDDDNGENCGAVRVFSGADGVVIRTIYGLTAGDQLGVGLCAAGDQDGDGQIDLASGAAYAWEGGGPGGEILVCSIETGGLIARLPGLGDGNALYGQGLAAIDFDGDGRVDLAGGAPFDAVAGALGGRVVIRAVGQRALSADVVRLSLAAGGTQRLVLSDLAHAGEPYTLLGSASGSAPPTPYGELLLPLVYDGYFAATATDPQSLGITSAQGFLNGNGRAEVVLDFPPTVDPTLIGIVLHHAFVAGSPSAFASTSVSLALDP